MKFSDWVLMGAKAMQDIDHAFKTLLALQPNSFLDLLFGHKRKIILRERAIFFIPGAL
jgi:hypothetical protein